MPEKLDELGMLADVRTAGRDLLLLFNDAPGPASVLRVVRVRADGRIVHVGRAVKVPRSITFLGLHGAPAILVQGLNDDARYVLALHRGKWRHPTDTLHRGEGPLVGGGGTAGFHQLIPVVEADRQPWRFSSYLFRAGTWEQLQLSRGAGDAQGNLGQPGQAVWAVWQENAFGHGSFDTKIRIGRYLQHAGRFSPPATLFNGPSPGPGDLQVARWHGKKFVLYMRPATKDSRNLNAYVRTVRWSD